MKVPRQLVSTNRSVHANICRRVVKELSAVLKSGTNKMGLGAKISFGSGPDLKEGSTPAPESTPAPKTAKKCYTIFFICRFDKESFINICTALMVNKT